MRCVVLHSGGLDSTVLLYHLRATGADVRALVVNYGQRHRCEISAATVICAQADISHQIIDLTSIAPLLGGSALTDDVPVPMQAYDVDSLKITVVPNRNMILLSLAAAWAVSLKFDAVAYAAHGGDHEVYPDCRPEFADAMDRALQLCDWHSVRLHQPFVNKSKAEVVSMGASLNVPFEFTWSCYLGGSIHCGQCGTCDERRKAFEIAGVPDPTRYETSE
jgi:7-cyano-7-deazaguanine synthase